MKPGCIAVLRAVTGGVATKCPVSLGENFENMCFGGFSKTRTFFLDGERLGAGGRLNSLQARRGMGCRRIAALQWLALSGGIR